MMVPQFIRFYPGYTRQSVLGEYAVTFFALVNAMYRLKAEEMMDSIVTTTAGMAESKDRANVLDQLRKAAKGLHGILQEVRNVRGK